MFEDQETLQILQGARLAGKKAPDQLNRRRAGAFVAKTLSAGKRPDSRFFSRYGGLLFGVGLSVAAGLGALLWLALSVDSRKGTRSILLENQSVHATTAVSDTLHQEKDSVEIPALEIVGNQ